MRRGSDGDVDGVVRGVALVGVAAPVPGRAVHLWTADVGTEAEENPMTVSAQTLAAMSPDDLNYWITYHEHQIGRDVIALEALTADGPGLRSVDYHAELVAARRDAIRLSTSALELMRGELQRREAHRR